MKKSIYIIPVLFIFVCVFLIQCFEETPVPTYSKDEGYNDLEPYDGVGGGSNTVTPHAPVANNTRGFQPQTGSEVYSTEDEEDDKNNPDNDPLYKSDNIRSREGRYGTSAPVVSFDYDTLEDFRLGRPFRSTDIKNMRIYVDMERAGGSRAYYQGKVTLSYNDSRSGVPYTQFSSGQDDNAQYNIWFRKSGKEVFHGFFQENEGSLILVVDRQTKLLQNPDDSNSVNPDNLRGGSIWVMMFRTTFRGATSCSNHSQPYISEYNKNLLFNVEPLPTLSQLPVKCWFKTIGPYDCRTWRTDRSVDTSRAVEPDDNCYAKLGDFEGLDITEAFNVGDFSNLVIH